jgi:hypothetical protein
LPFFLYFNSAADRYKLHISPYRDLPQQQYCKKQDAWQQALRCREMAIVDIMAQKGKNIQQAGFPDGHPLQY